MRANRSSPGLRLVARSPFLPGSRLAASFRSPFNIVQLGFNNVKGIRIGLCIVRLYHHDTYVPFQPAFFGLRVPSGFKLQEKLQKATGAPKLQECPTPHAGCHAQTAFGRAVARGALAPRLAARSLVLTLRSVSPSTLLKSALAMLMESALGRALQRLAIAILKPSFSPVLQGPVSPRTLNGRKMCTNIHTIHPPSPATQCRHSPFPALSADGEAAHKAPLPDSGRRPARHFP